MFTKLKNRQEGFTIIEVLIVLAIAGAIMLIVFLAVPALQRSSRNNQRDSDASRVGAAVNECLSNRNGVVASCDASTEVDAGTMAQLTTVTFSTSASPNPTPASGNVSTVAVWHGGQCAADGSSATFTAGSRFIAILYRLEPDVVRCTSG